MSLIDYKKVNIEGDKKKGIPPYPKRRHQTDMVALQWLAQYYPEEYNKLACSMGWVTCKKYESN